MKEKRVGKGSSSGSNSIQSLDASPDATRKGLKGIGIRGKLYIYLLIPLIIIFSASSFITIRQTVSLIQNTSHESNKVVTQMAENEIEMATHSVASQVKMYLLNRPKLKKEEFQNDPEFFKLAVQSVGRTGYTTLYELPDEKGLWMVWAHSTPKIAGTDMNSVKEKLGADGDQFWKIFTGVLKQKESEGYYIWKDPDGRIREKYMVCAPVEGTRFIVASTTYMDEFTAPMKRIEKSSRAAIANIINFVIAGSIIVILAMVIIIFVYSRSLIGKIRYLASAAEQISVGNMDVEIMVRSNDEIGELAEAISRMQESVRLAIVRLRRR